MQFPARSYDWLYSVVGIVLYLFGFFIAMWARYTMKEKWLPAGEGHDAKRQNELFTKGPFRITRNPIYVGLLCLYSGIFITLRSPLFLLVILPFIFFYRSAKTEETYLEKQFGAAFREYKKRVPLFLLK